MHIAYNFKFKQEVFELLNFVYLGLRVIGLR